MVKTIIRSIDIGSAYKYNFDRAIKIINDSGGTYKQTVLLNEETIIVYTVESETI